MSTSNHTPGPWYFKKNINLHDQGLVIAEKTGASIAVTYDSRDAMLIAAAPTMLATLQAVLESMGDYYDATDAAGDEGGSLHDLVESTIRQATQS